MTNTTFDRMLELVDHAHDAGIELPMHPRVIVALEDAGFTVNLATGAVSPAHDDDTAAPTMAAYPMADVMTELSRMAVQRVVD